MKCFEYVDEMSQQSGDDANENPTRFDLDHDSVGRIFRKLIVVCLLSAVLSMMIMFLMVLSAAEDPLSDQPGPTVQAPIIGAVFLLSIAGIPLSLFGYGVWSFREHHRLRKEMPNPKEPNPFKKPRRLLAIFTANTDDLTRYEKRVQLTEYSFLFGILVMYGFLDTLNIV